MRNFRKKPSQDIHLVVELLQVLENLCQSLARAFLRSFSLCHDLLSGKDDDCFFFFLLNRFFSMSCSWVFLEHFCSFSNKILQSQTRKKMLKKEGGRLSSGPRVVAGAGMILGIHKDK